jgi:hypothetical protein
MPLPLPFGATLLLPLPTGVLLLLPLPPGERAG